MKRSVTIRFLLVACLPLSAFADPIKIAGTPVQIDVSMVTGRTIRIDILPLDEQGKPRPKPPSSIMVPYDMAGKIVESYRDTNTFSINMPSIGNFKVSLKANPLTFTINKPDGKLLQEITVKDSDGSLIFHTDSPTFGLGEGRQQFDRRGFYFDFQNGQNTFLDTHGCTMPVPFLIGSDNNGAGWGMFIHNPPPLQQNARSANLPWGQFDLRGEDAGPPPRPPRCRWRQRSRPWCSYRHSQCPRRSPGHRSFPCRGARRPSDSSRVRPTKGRFIPRQDTLNQAPTSIYIMNLDTPADALTEYTHLVGSPVMPPKWVMGYMQSHRSLAGSDEVLAVAKKLRDDKLPCDALIYLGTGYTIATQPNQPLGGWNLRNGSLDFNDLLFPKEMIAKLHELDYKIILHKTNAPATLHGNINDTPDGPTHVAAYWATHTPLMTLGVDSWWPDDGDELPIENRMARIKAYYDGPLKDRPNDAPWSLDRNGYAGVAKYGGWNWSGDVVSRWATLAAHVPDGVQFSLSVSPWWGTDIGGFSGSSEYSGELYTRWFQFGAFNPLFRSHGRNWHLHTPWGWNTGEPGPVESPLPAAATLQAELHNDQVEPICKKYLELRYQLLPYNYTITREACDTGLPPMRALLLSYPNDPTAVSLGDEYLWGPDILVAPVVEKGAKERKVYLPEGTWYDYWTGDKQEGKKWITRFVDLATMPLYIKAGAIIPMDPVRQYTGQSVAEPTTLAVYPGANSSFTLYDDDGHTQGYLDGTDPKTQWLRITWNDATKKLSIDPDPRMKNWPSNQTRTFKIQLIGTDPAKPVDLQIDFKGQHAETTL